MKLSKLLLTITIASLISACGGVDQLDKSNPVESSDNNNITDQNGNKYTPKSNIKSLVNEGYYNINIRSGYSSGTKEKMTTAKISGHKVENSQADLSLFLEWDEIENTWKTASAEKKLQKIKRHKEGAIFYRSSTDKWQIMSDFNQPSQPYNLSIENNTLKVTDDHFLKTSSFIENEHDLSDKLIQDSLIKLQKLIPEQTSYPVTFELFSSNGDAFDGKTFKSGAKAYEMVTRLDETYITLHPGEYFGTPLSSGNYAFLDEALQDLTQKQEPILEMIKYNDTSLFSCFSTYSSGQTAGNCEVESVLNKHENESISWEIQNFDNKKVLTVNTSFQPANYPHIAYIEYQFKIEEGRIEYENSVKKSLWFNQAAMESIRDAFSPTSLVNASN